jgi:hypothetical protein
VTMNAGCFLDPADRRWAEALEQVPHDVYQTPEYVKIEAARLGAEPVAFLVREERALFLAPLLLRRMEFDVDHGTNGVTDAISPYGYPGVAFNETAASAPGFIDSCFVRLIGALQERSVCSVFMRLHPVLNAGLSALLESFELTDSGATVSVDLEHSEARIWARMRKGHTNAVNRARRTGYEVEIGSAIEHFSAFVRVYEETLERVRSTATSEFAVEDLRRLAGLTEARIAVARLDGEVAGAYLFYECNGIVQMHLGGTRSAHMRPSPSNLLIHAVALWAKARGDSMVHLGGGVGGATVDGLFTFKSGFSPDRHAYQTLRIVVDEARYQNLVRKRAAALLRPPEVLLKSGFFPAYRVS